MSDNSGSISKLLDKLDVGDKHAEDVIWEEIRSVTEKIAQKVCRQKGVNQSNVDDIVHDSIIAIINIPDPNELYSKLKDVRSWNSWLSTIVTNKVFDFLRKKNSGIGSWLSLDNVINGSDSAIDTFEKFLKDEKVNIETNYQHRRLFQFILEKIAEMPKEWQEPYRLYIKGHTYIEIENITGSPITTLNNWISRAKKFIKKELKEFGVKLSDLKGKTHG